jgi:hypothetical protein
VSASAGLKGPFTCSAIARGNRPSGTTTITDIFSLGADPGQPGARRDFTEADELEAFVRCRENSALNARLNPVLASVIVQMTELNRHRRPGFGPRSSGA